MRGPLKCFDMSTTAAHLQHNSAPIGTPADLGTHLHSPLPLGARTLSPTTWSTYTLPYHLEHLHSPLPLGALTLSPTTWSTGACTSAATTTAVLGCCDKFQEIYLLCSSHSIHNVWTADGGLQLLQRLVDQLHPLKCKVAACSVKLDDKERPWWA